jgi:hypothetical protein
MISGSVIKNAAVDFRFSAVRKLERLRGLATRATLFDWTATSAIVLLPCEFHIAGKPALSATRSLE